MSRCFVYGKTIEVLIYYFSTNLLHSNRIIDQTISTRTVLAEAVAKQFFGTFIAMQTWYGLVK